MINMFLMHVGGKKNFAIPHFYSGENPYCFSNRTTSVSFAGNYLEMHFYWYVPASNARIQVLQGLKVLSRIRKGVDNNVVVSDVKQGRAEFWFLLELICRSNSLKFLSIDTSRWM